MAKWMLPVLVLRADLWLEHHMVGGADEVHKALHGANNDADEFHSRLYFFRGALRSLYSTKKVLQRLMGLAEFRAMLEASKHRAEFYERLNTLHRAAEEFESLRNSIGGHVEDDVAQARAHINDDDVLPVEFNDQQGLTGRLAAPVLFAVIFGHEPDEAEVKALRIRMRDAGLAAFRALELAINVYLQHKLPTR